MVPVPYQIVAFLEDACMASHNVKFAGEPAVLVDQSMVMSVVGNEAGVVGGIKSGHNRWIVEFDQGSNNVHVNGKQVVRYGDPCWMNGRNTRGKVICTDGMGPACGIKNGRPMYTEETAAMRPSAAKNGEAEASSCVAGKGKGVTVKGSARKLMNSPQICSLRWQTLSAIDGTPTARVDVIVVDSATCALKETLRSGDDGRTERLQNETGPEDYTALVGSGDWTTVITTDDDPKMLEYTDWFDREAEE